MGTFIVKGLRAHLKKFKMKHLILNAFDVYQRYKLISEIASDIDYEAILDVGGSEGHIKTSLRKGSLWVIDIDRGDILGSGVNLPFKDNSFDLVTCIDVLQYIPAEKREKIINELLRVGEKCVIIALPLDTTDVVRAERECNSFYRSLFGRDNEWLGKTAKCGLPKSEEIDSMLKNHSVSRFENGYLRRWVIMIKINYITEKIRRCGSNLMSPFCQIIGYMLYFALNSIYNLIFYRFDNRRVAYRRFFLVRI